MISPQVLTFLETMRKGVDEEVERFVDLSLVASGSQTAQCCMEVLTGKEAQQALSTVSF